MPDHIEPDIWDEPEMCRALAARAITTVYRLLQAKGVSQRQIADLTGQSTSEVSEIIHGRRVLAYDVLKRIADGLGIPHGRMGIAYSDADGCPARLDANGNIVAYPGGEGEGNPDPEVDADMISRRVLGASSAALLGSAVIGDPGGLRLLDGPPGTLGKHDVPWINNMATTLWELDLQHGGGAAYGLARGAAEHVVGALRTSPPNREVQIAASKLCWNAAWSAFDAGYRRIFWQCHATALELAKEAGDTATVVALVSAAGRAEILSGNHRAAAKLFELVSIRKQFNAVDWGLLGSAYAPHSPDSAKRTLVHMRDSKGANTLDAYAMTGHVSLDVGDYASAVSAFDKVVPQRTGRLAVQEMVPLAIAHLKAGEVRTGVQHAERVLILVEQVRSTQCSGAMHKLSAELATHKDSTAQDLARRIAAISA